MREVPDRSVAVLGFKHVLVGQHDLVLMVWIGNVRQRVPVALSRGVAAGGGAAVGRVCNDTGHKALMPGVSGLPFLT
jgi:hypothetical protein